MEPSGGSVTMRGTVARRLRRQAREINQQERRRARRLSGRLGPDRTQDIYRGLKKQYKLQRRGR